VNPLALRGGSWNNNQNNARLAARINNNPNNNWNNNGFRVVVFATLFLFRPAGNAARLWHRTGFAAEAQRRMAGRIPGRDGRTGHPGEYRTAPRPWVRPRRGAPTNETSEVLKTSEVWQTQPCMLN